MDWLPIPHSPAICHPHISKAFHLSSPLSDAFSLLVLILNWTLYVLIMLQHTIIGCYMVTVALRGLTSVLDRHEYIYGHVSYGSLFSNAVIQMWLLVCESEMLCEDSSHRVGGDVGMVGVWGLYGILGQDRSGWKRWRYSQKWPSQDS